MLAERVPALARALSVAMVALGIASAAALPAQAVVTDRDPATVDLAIAVPLTVPANTEGLISAQALEQYTSPLGLLTRQLDAVINRPVAIGIDPSIIASIRILGTSAPESATSWLTRLETATNETFALTWADADITLATQAGSTSVPATESLDFAVDPALFAPVTDEPDQPEEPAGTATPEPTTEPVDPVDPVIPERPSTEELLAWPYDVTGLAWPRDDTVIGSDLATITASGYQTAMLSSANVDAPATAGSAVTIGDTRVLVSDSTVSNALRTAATSVSAESWLPAVTALGDAVAAWGATRTGVDATAIATLDRSILINGSRLAETLDSLDTDPAIALVPLSDAIGARHSAATIVDEPQPTEALNQAARMLASEAADRQFATVAEDPVAITSHRRLLLLALLSSAWSANPDGWGAAVEDYTSDSQELRESVHVVEGSTVNFLADRAPLSIAVTNDLDQAVTVFITLRPQTAQLAVGDDRVELTIEPNSQARGEVPVQAISNGQVRVSVSLTSPTGIPIGDVTTADINVQAGWETPIVVVVAVIVVVFFGFGIVRNIVRRRRKPAGE